MAGYRTETSIATSPDRVWAVLADVPRWPEWTSSMTEFSYLSGDSLSVGARLRVRQPKLRTAVWTVTEVVPGSSFTWTAAAPGVGSVAEHVIEADGDGSRVRLRFEQSGPLAGAVGLIYGRLIRRYLDIEAAGLKRAAEAR